MTMLSRLVDETFTISRFTVIGLMATATHALVGSGAAFAGVPVLIANALGFLVAWTVSFYGHYTFTFGRPNDMRVARTRFIVISLCLFAISQLTVGLLQATEMLAAWVEPVIGAIVVPPASYVLYRLYVFAPEGEAAGARSLRLPQPLKQVLGLHRLLVPFLLFAMFFSLSVLDPTDVGWLSAGDLGQHYAGWLAFLNDDWRWPLGFSELVAHPHGMPLTATDSNPLVAIPMKLLAFALPQQIQFVGYWYLLCIILSYNIVFNLLNWMSQRPLPAALVTVIVIATPFFFRRYGHDTLMAHWLIFASLSVFIRPGSDRRAIAKHAAVVALSICVHPYFVPMTLSIAGMDILRRGYRRYTRAGAPGKVLGFLAGGVATVVLPALLVGWIIGLFALKTVPQPVGWYSTDPFAWFNGRGYSLLLTGWQMPPGQMDEGIQYPGLGALLVAVIGAFLWATRLARPPERLLRALLWLAPAVLLLFLVGISPVVTVFGVRIVSVQVMDWPLVGPVFSAFRSSGRLVWPLTYVALLTAAALWLTVRSRAITPILAALVALQLVDISPLAESIRRSTAHRDMQYQHLREEDQWRQLVDASDRLYAAAGIGKPVLVELGLMAFPQGKALNRFYFAQALETPDQTDAERREHATVRAGTLADDMLYVLDPVAIGSLLIKSPDSLGRLQELDGMIVSPPAGVTVEAENRVRFKPRPDVETLIDLVKNCQAGCALALSVRDEATSALPKEFVDQIEARGGTIGSLQFRGSYAAILLDGQVADEAIASGSDVSVAAMLFGDDVKVFSGGASASNCSSITVNGLELSPNARGINIVRLEPGGVSAINAFDTYRDASKALVP